MPGPPPGASGTLVDEPRRRTSGRPPEIPPGIPPVVTDVRLDAGSPADALPAGMLRADPAAGIGSWRHDASSYDSAMMLLTASDNTVSDRLATALLEVKDKRLYQREGHARWSTYLRAFVGPTARWCQQEMRRVRTLRQFPLLAEAWSRGEISKSRLRVVLRVVTEDTQAEWLQKARTSRVLQLDRVAQAELSRRRQNEADCETSAAGQVVEDPDEPGGRRRCRTVMTPPAVAAMVAEAVELARKVEGYHISPGTAVSLMAAETLTALNAWPDVSQPPGSDAGSGENQPGEHPPEPESRDARPPASLLGDEERREVGRLWQDVLAQADSWRRPGRLEDDPPGVVFDAVPADDADAHQRVVFWSAVQGRLDALRGAAGKALQDLPVAHRMYASGRLGRRKAWLVSRVATRRTNRAWTRFALTHTLRLLEALADKHDLMGRTGARDAGGGMPPEDATFAGVTRACSQLKGLDPSEDPVVRVRLVMDRQQEAVFEDAMRALRADHGADKPDWWFLGVMASHFLDTYAELDRRAVPEKLRLHRRIIERDNHTCCCPECLQRGGLEADHSILRSQGGPDEEWNLNSACVAEHRFSKHQAGTLAIYGRAPGDLTIRMGSRVYRNDRLVEPAFDERVLDDDPWALKEARVEYVTCG